eukprot:3210984-Pleurochrysis_carterae.AAC.1
MDEPAAFRRMRAATWCKARAAFGSRRARRGQCNCKLAASWVQQRAMDLTHRRERQADSQMQGYRSAEVEEVRACARARVRACARARVRARVRAFALPEPALDRAKTVAFARTSASLTWFSCARIVVRQRAGLLRAHSRAAQMDY